MGWHWKCRWRGVGAALAAALLSAGSAEAVVTCTAAGIAAVEPNCPNDPSLPCQIRSKIEADPAQICNLDFRGRDVTIGSDGPAGTLRSVRSIFLKARSLTILPNGLINGRGDHDRGASFYADITGPVTLARQGAQMGTIDASGAAGESGGTVEIDADGTITIDGLIRAGKQANAPDETGPSDVAINSKADIVGSGQIVDPAGIYSDNNAGVSLYAVGRIDFAGTIDVSGYATTLSVYGLGDVRLHEVDGVGDGIPSYGGAVDIEAKGDVLLTGDLDLRAIGNSNGDESGEGGNLTVSGGGSVTVLGRILCGATGIFGIAGTWSFEAPGDVVFENGSLLSSTAGNSQGYGGDGYVTAGRDLLMRGKIDATAKEQGGEIELFATRHVELAATGSIDASAVVGSDYASSGTVTIEAGHEGSGHLRIDGDIDTNSAGCLYGAPYGYSSGMALSGCDIRIGAEARIRACGHEAGYIEVTSRGRMAIAGEILAPKLGTTGGSEGKIVVTLVHPFTPEMGAATFQPQPEIVERANCALSPDPGCLSPCSECGLPGAAGTADVWAAAKTVAACNGVLASCDVAPGQASGADLNFNGSLTPSELTRFVARRLQPGGADSCLP